MNIFKILGGIGAGVLAAAGLVVAGRTGLGKSDEPAETTEPAAGGDAPATETEEKTSDAEPESDDSADA